MKNSKNKSCAAPKEREPVTHALKINSEYFHAVAMGEKSAEFRRADRDYRVGDLLTLREYGSFPWIDVKQGFSGEEITVQITHITDLSKWAAGYVMLSIRHEICTQMLDSSDSFDDELPF
ncbi:DUF3850 domain-containing protein [Limnobaculum xujianqingii]|uniref:DUF3850 domain-containing protein n=1 Tax=Limnobaculum xujianqingii TaxID=2738837 RepID=UPI00112ABA30|nr:DUF3850 domain-containing protein [Limnobaculum xujianqingii]